MKTDYEVEHDTRKKIAMMETTLRQVQSMAKLEAADGSKAWQVVVETIDEVLLLT